MKKDTKTTIIIIIMIAVIIQAAVFIAVQEKYEEAVFVCAIDGDTIVAKTKEGQKKIRLIGIDCKEAKTEKGKKATEYLEKLIKPGDTVYLEKDKSETDKYQRLLRYVYIENSKNEKIMINECLLVADKAEVMTIMPDKKYSEKFNSLKEKK